MKRFFLLLSVIALMTSCTIVNNDTTDVVNLTVSSQDWVVNYDPGNSIPRYYSYTFAMPEITSLQFENGLVQAYAVFRSGEQISSQQVLPYVQHYKDLNLAMWTRTIDYRYAPGELTVFVTNSDFIVDPPESMDFRVVLIP